MVTKTSPLTTNTATKSSYPPLAEKSTWDQIRSGAKSVAGGVVGGAKRVYGGAKTFAENHPINHERKEKPERRTRSDRSETQRQERPEHGRVSRVDKYVDGKVSETVYFSTNEKVPRKPRTQPSKQKQFARGAANVLGDVGRGLDMSAFIPSNMGLGRSMGYEQPPRAKNGKKRGGDWTDPGYIPENIRHLF